MNLGTATIYNACSAAIRVLSDIGTEVTIVPGASADVRVAYRREHVELTIEAVDAPTPRRLPDRDPDRGF